MSWLRESSCHPRRILIAPVLLAANLMAVGVPMVHALAHESSHTHDASHHDQSAHMGDEEGSHDDVHPLVLHDDWVFGQPVTLDLEAALPVEQHGPRLLGAEVVYEAHASYTVQSRAPPASLQARAPPLS